MSFPARFWALVRTFRSPSPLFYPFLTILSSKTKMTRTDARDRDSNRLNATWYYAGAADFARPPLLLPWRVSHTLLPPDAIVPYLKEARFGDTTPLRDFVFDNSLITTFVKQWHPETHTFHLLWGEATITLQDMAYHLGLRTHGEPVGGASMTSTGDATDRQPGDTSTVCEVLHLVTNREIPDDGQVEQLGPSTMAATASGLSAVLWVVLGLGGACIYHLLCSAAHRGTTDITGCTPLLMSWICQRFSQWCPPDRRFFMYSMAARLIGLTQQSRNQHEARVLRWRLAIDQLRWDEVDRVKCQFDGEQLVPGAPVNVDRFQTSTGGDEDVWWPDRLDDSRAREVRKDTRWPARRERGDREHGRGTWVKRERVKFCRERLDVESDEEAEFNRHEDHGDIAVGGDDSPTATSSTSRTA
ncbi:hypothetical protein Ahy_B06g081334 [Arachis hypogaea]|uniref:Aminotransferase-like plant mobile domain-containing protein n=1 Tax=Arachis hypogaea TaxID=3818 RepID=A0A444YKR3_ARAHY|nr:hypothetical protein Ahy_B06g081334 [Arachis hypogaea]